MDSVIEKDFHEEEYFGNVRLDVCTHIYFNVIAIITSSCRIQQYCRHLKTLLYQ